jgi:hypothetical protein
MSCGGSKHDNANAARVSEAAQEAGLSVHQSSAVFHGIVHDLKERENMGQQEAESQARMRLVRVCSNPQDFGRELPTAVHRVQDATFAQLSSGRPSPQVTQRIVAQQMAASAPIPMLYELLRAPKVPHDQLMILAQHDSPYVRGCVARHQNLPSDVAEYLAESHGSEVREALINNPSSSQQALVTCYEHTTSPRERDLIMGHENAPDENAVSESFAA